MMDFRQVSYLVKELVGLIYSIWTWPVWFLWYTYYRLVYLVMAIEKCFWYYCVTRVVYNFFSASPSTSFMFNCTKINPKLYGWNLKFSNTGPLDYVKYTRYTERETSVTSQIANWEKNYSPKIWTQNYANAYVRSQAWRHCHSSTNETATASAQSWKTHEDEAGINPVSNV